MIFCENLKAIPGGSTATSRAFVPSDRNMDGLEACCGIATKLNLSPNQGLFHPGFFAGKLPTQNQQLFTQGKGAPKQAFQETLPSQRRPQLLLACFWKPSCKAVYRTKQDRNATWIYKTCLEIGPKNKGCARICLMLAV